MRAAIYARLSVPGDADETTGIDRQLADGRRYAASFGATSVVTYVDDGISAYNKRAKRPAFERLLDDVEAAKVDVIIAWRADRLARQGRDAERLLDAIEDRARVIGVADGLDSSTPAGDFILRMFVQIGNWESRGISTRVRRAHESIAEQGRPSGGPRGFGHTVDRRGIVPEEADAIRNATDRLLAGESVKSILRDWNARGLKTPRGNDWQHTAFVKLLQQPRMVGVRALRGIEGSGHMPPILDRDTWEQVRALLTDPARKPARPGGQPRHLLTGLLRCGECGGPLKAKGNSGRKNGPNYSTYGCVGGCGRVWIKASKTDEYIEGLTVAALSSPALARLVAGEDSDASNLAENRRRFVRLRERVMDLETRLLRSQYESDPDGISPDAYQRLIKETKREVADLEAELARHDETRVLSAALIDPLAFWEAATLEQRRALVRLVFPSIVVERASTLREYPQRWDERRLRVTPAA
jgi:DNA invertase Pin-like site-specific DNA recombinase